MIACNVTTSQFQQCIKSERKVIMALLPLMRPLIPVKFTFTIKILEKPWNKNIGEKKKRFMLRHESPSAGILPHRLWIRLTPLMFRNREQAYQLWLNFAFTESEEKKKGLMVKFWKSVSVTWFRLSWSCSSSPRWLLERLFVGLMWTHPLWTATLTGCWGPGEKYELNQIKWMIFYF